MSKVLLLLSGGLDSSTCLAELSNSSNEIYTLTFDYGQNNRYEIKCAKQLSKLYKVKKHFQIRIFSSIFSNTSSLTQKNKNISEPYVPGRNIIFLSYSVSIAERYNIEDIYISLNKDDSYFPDCQLSFIKLFEEAVNQGIKTDRYVSIKTPYLEKSKSDIIGIAHKINLDFNLTQSCYNPDQNGIPCLKCSACLLRMESFKNSGLTDKLYAVLEH